MCIDCARKAIQHLIACFPPGPGGWRICLLDHDDHVHIRVHVAGAGGTVEFSEWVDLVAPWADIYPMLPENTFVHIHHDLKSNGLHSNVIDQIEKLVWDGRKDGNIFCSICRDTFTLGEDILVLPCKHRYHVECIKTWLKRKDTCPVCRLCVTSVEIEKNKELQNDLRQLRRRDEKSLNNNGHIQSSNSSLLTVSERTQRTQPTSITGAYSVISEIHAENSLSPSQRINKKCVIS